MPDPHPASHRQHQCDSSLHPSHSRIQQPSFLLLNLAEKRRLCGCAWPLSFFRLLEQHLRGKRVTAKKSTGKSWERITQQIDYDIEKKKKTGFSNSESRTDTHAFIRLYTWLLHTPTPCAKQKTTESNIRAKQKKKTWSETKVLCCVSVCVGVNYVWTRHYVRCVHKTIHQPH